MWLTFFSYTCFGHRLWRYIFLICLHVLHTVAELHYASPIVTLYMHSWFVRHPFLFLVFLWIWIIFFIFILFLAFLQFWRPFDSSYLIAVECLYAYFNSSNLICSRIFLYYFNSSILLTLKQFLHPFQF
jgi:hypothetical protein